MEKLHVSQLTYEISCDTQYSLSTLDGAHRKQSPVYSNGQSKFTRTNQLRITKRPDKHKVMVMEKRK